MNLSEAASHALRGFLLMHEGEIASGIEAYGVLWVVFTDVIGREPGETEQ